MTLASEGSLPECWIGVLGHDAQKGCAEHLAFRRVRGIGVVGVGEHCQGMVAAVTIAGDGVEVSGLDS